jgi:hypothetical protein
MVERRARTVASEVVYVFRVVIQQATRHQCRGNKGRNDEKLELKFTLLEERFRQCSSQDFKHRGNLLRLPEAIAQTELVDACVLHRGEMPSMFFIFGPSIGLS